MGRLIGLGFRAYALGFKSGGLGFRVYGGDAVAEGTEQDLGRRCRQLLDQLDRGSEFWLGFATSTRMTSESRK